MEIKQRGLYYILYNIFAGACHRRRQRLQWACALHPDHWGCRHAGPSQHQNCHHLKEISIDTKQAKPIGELRIVQNAAHEKYFYISARTLCHLSNSIFFVVQASLQLDQETGTITVTDNTYFDRETKESESE